MQTVLRLMLLSLVMLSPAVARADLQVAGVFSDNMVLQQGVEVPVWGTAEAGERVVVRFHSEELTGTADAKGKWVIKLPVLKATRDQKGAKLTVAGAKKTVTFANVVIGEVWLCSGQSNMQWSLAASDAEEDSRAADFPAIRHRGLGGNWTVCTPQTAPGFTAVGFYFARKIHKETGFPVGLLNNAIGGTAIEPWLAPGSYENDPALKPMLDMQAARVKQYNSAIAGQLDGMEKWLKAARRAVEEKKDVPPMPVLPPYPTAPFSTLYQPFTEPLRPYAIRGMLWYQGESNGGEREIYYHKMKALIGGLRKGWGQGEFPAYVVQLPQIGGPSDNPEGGDGWAPIRMAQMKCLSIPKTGVAVTIDVGDPGDIHPRNKLDVGERLALWALAKEYGKKGLVYSGPVYKGMKVEGAKVRLSFDHVGGGLMVGTKDGKKPAEEVKNGKLKRFAIADASGTWHWADAVIDGSDVVVSSAKVMEPVAVRYAYQNNPVGANLYNREGLPAMPFRTDDGNRLVPKKKNGK